MAQINKTFYIDRLEEVDVCGTKFISFIGGTFQLPFEIKPSEGEHTYSTCEGCRNQRDHLIKILSEKNIFPQCCEGHKKLHLLEQFNLADYKNLEASVVDKIIYVSQFVVNNIDNDDWLEDFENYFEYVLESLGSFPSGYGSPYQLSNFYSFVIEIIENKMNKLHSDKLSIEQVNIRLETILNHVHNAFHSADEKQVQSKNKDVNLLLSIYSKWYKTFPFELSYFKPLQLKYGRRLPLLNGEVTFNKYTGVSKAKLHTKESLTQFLVNLTRNIIVNINGLRLYEKGLLSNTEKVNLELILKNRELELAVMNSVDGIDSRGYIKILKKWFDSEKKFIKEITPLLKDKNEPVSQSAETKLSMKQIALKLVYEGAAVNRNKSQEIAKEYGHTSGEKLFQEFTYFSSPANRKGNPSPVSQKKFQNKIELFESVIELLSDANKQRASDEINILKMNRDNLFG